MAIVKASYTRSRSKIKATLRYIIHRPGREGEKLTRVLFGHDGEEMSKADAYQLIDAQKGLTYFHLKLNFHPKQEDKRKDLNLQDITNRTCATLEKQLQRSIRFLAVEHNDHSPLRHIHAIVLVKLKRGERVTWQDWKVCRDAATEYALFERRALDAVRRAQQERRLRTLYRRRSLGRAGEKAKGTRAPSARALFRHACPNCGAGQEMQRYRNEFVCRNCGYRQERKRRWSMELGL